MARGLAIDMKKRPRQRRAEATVEAMLQAADELLSALPYDKVTTNRIAERAGVGIGSLYQYFPNKEAIVARVVTQWVDAMLAEVGDRLAAGAQLELAAAAQAMVSALFEVVDRHRVKVRLILEVIPFALQIPAVAELPASLIAISAATQASIRDRLNFARPEAASYVLMVMSRASIIETVLHCPRHIDRADIEYTIADFVARIMLGNAPPAPKLAPQN